MSKDITKLKLASISFGIIIALLIAEVGLRIIKFMTFQNLNKIEFGNRTPINQPNDELTLGQIIQISDNNKIIYQLIPNSSYRFENASIKTNDEGFKDKTYPKIKPLHTRRIIGIGDSGMFGWGVEEEDCYLTQLENRLNLNDSLNFEVINTSVPGYNTVMEVEVLEKKIQLDQVDLVIIDFITNDFELPSFIRKKPDFTTLEKSFFLMFFEGDFFSKKRKRDEWLIDSPMDQEGYFESKVENVPEEYRNLVGKEAYVVAMQRLKELGDEYGFEIIVLSQSPHLKIPKIVTETCDNLDLRFIDFAPHWEKYKSKNPTAQWKLSDDDWHPTAEGHREISNTLFEVIQKLSL
ncbi:MAG: SGNH/GDSL hydrolase family protein [Saprospiraceae bacterium]